MARSRALLFRRWPIRGSRLLDFFSVLLAFQFPICVSVFSLMFVVSKDLDPMTGLRAGGPQKLDGWLTLMAEELSV